MDILRVCSVFKRTPLRKFRLRKGVLKSHPPIRNMNVIVQIKLNDIGRKLGIILIATIEVLKPYFTFKRTRNWGNIWSGILLLFCYYGQCHKEMSPTKTCKYLTIYEGGRPSRDSGFGPFFSREPGF